MKSSKLNKIIASFLASFACFSIGYGGWNIHAEKSYSVGEKGDNPVAYIKNGTSKTYYLKLEDAVKVANNSDSKKVQSMYGLFQIRIIQLLVHSRLMNTLS